MTWLPHTTPHEIGRIEHGRRPATRAVVIHVNDGSTPGTFSWWAQPGHEADGAHVQISHDGHAYQCAPLETLCWHAGAANAWAIGFEHEGFPNQDWLAYPGQLHASANRCAWVLHEYNLGPPRLHRNLFGHGMGGAAWGGHPDCPGPKFPWEHYVRLVNDAYRGHWGRHHAHAA